MIDQAHNKYNNNMQSRSMHAADNNIIIINSGPGA